jgi:hypothetical protein
MPVNARSKVARFEQPIVAVKNFIQPEKKPSTDEDNTKGKRVKQKEDDLMELVEMEKKDYVVCHVSFQSTGGTNITSVNALSNVELFVHDRNKGRGENKRTLGIEMNEARETYLKTYSAVDKINQILLEWEVKYRSRRWWNTPTRCQGNYNVYGI